MKAFFNKIRKSNKVFLSLYLITVILYLISYIFFTINILHLSTIETGIRIVMLIFFGLWLFMWLICGLVFLFTKKFKGMIILIVLTTIFSGIFIFSSYYISRIYNTIDGMSKEKVVYTTNLITMKNHEFGSSSKIGMINDSEDIEGFILGNKLIKNNSLTNEINRYDDYLIMLNDLYNNKIDAAVVSGNYVINFSSEEQFENIQSETKVVYTLSEEMKNQDNVSYTNKKLTEPFTVLLMGVDSENDGLNANQAFNGDTLMLITFNPKTLTASVFSIPRDTYVPIACRNGAYAKINSAAASGTNCVIKTIKNLTDIDIDFYVKINFKGVVDLVDTIGGITVDVEKPYFRFNNGIDYHGQVCEQNSNRDFGNSTVCIDPGVQRLNGEQALAYSRNRHQYIGSDLDRVKHQQQVISALANEIKNLSSFEQFEGILNAVEKNMDTNMKNDQILSLYNVAKKIALTALSGKSDEIVSINHTYLETFSLPVWIGYSRTSALGYYKDSLDDIIKMMKINLGLEEEKEIKNYEIDYNDDYKSKYYGERIRTNPVQVLMPNLIGKSKEEASNWITSNGKTPSIKYVSPGQEHYNGSVGTGIVSDQDIHIDSLINNISTITLYVNEGKAPSISETIQNNTQSNKIEEEKKEVVEQKVVEETKKEEEKVDDKKTEENNSQQPTETTQDTSNDDNKTE